MAQRIWSVERGSATMGVPNTRPYRMKRLPKSVVLQRLKPLAGSRLLRHLTWTQFIGLH
jgi:hypothetical protein